MRQYSVIVGQAACVRSYNTGSSSSSSGGNRLRHTMCGSTRHGLTVGRARAYNEVMIVTMPRTNTGRVNGPIDPTDMQTMTPSTMARMSRILAPCCSEQQKHARSS